MNKLPCPAWADIRSYLDRRGEGAVPAEVAGDDEFKAIVVHLAGCAACRSAYVQEVSLLHEDERAGTEAERWAAITGWRAAVSVGLHALPAEALSPVVAGSPETQPEPAAKDMIHAAGAWLRGLLDQARAFRLTVTMPAQVVFVGARGGTDSVAAQQFPFELASLCQGGWSSRGTAWITPREILLQLRPTGGAEMSKTPRFVFRSRADELLWLDEPVRSEVLADGSHLFLAWRLDNARTVDAQVHLPLDGFVWFSED